MDKMLASHATSSILPTSDSGLPILCFPLRIVLWRCCSHKCAACRLRMLCHDAISHLLVAWGCIAKAALMRGARSYKGCPTRSQNPIRGDCIDCDEYRDTFTVDNTSFLCLSLSILDGVVGFESAEGGHCLRLELIRALQKRRGVGPRSCSLAA